MPSWSADGNWIYFTSARTGKYQIWKVPSNGGAAVQVTRSGGFTTFEAPHRRTLYYTRGSPASKLLKSPWMDGSGESEVLDAVVMRGFVVRDDRVYYLHPEPGGATRLRSLDSRDSDPSTALRSSQGELEAE